MLKSKRNQCLVLSLLLASTTVSAQKVVLRRLKGERLWEDYDKKVDKPICCWKDGLFKVKILQSWNTGLQIKLDNPSIHVDGNNLNLFYHVEFIPPPPPGQPAPPGAVAAILLEFTISGIHFQNYQVKVSRIMDPDPKP